MRLEVIPAGAEIRLERSREAALPKPSYLLHKLSYDEAVRRVLIVDDDPKVCETLDRYLSHAGYATASALDGKKALEAMRTFAPDLIVLDLMVPEVDGLEICRSLRGVPLQLAPARQSLARR